MKISKLKMSLTAVILALAFLILALYVGFIAFFRKKETAARPLSPDIPDPSPLVGSPASIVNFIFSTFKDKDLKELLGASAINGASGSSLGTLNSINLIESGTGGDVLNKTNYSWAISKITGLQDSVLGSPPSASLAGPIVYNTSLPYYAFDVPVSLSFSSLSAVAPNVIYRVGSSITDSSMDVRVSAAVKIGLVVTYLYNIAVPYSIKIGDIETTGLSVDSQTSDPLIKTVVDKVAAGPISRLIQSVLPSILNRIIPNSLLNKVASSLYSNYQSLSNELSVLQWTLSLLKEIAAGFDGLSGSAMSLYISSLDQEIASFQQGISLIQYFAFYSLTLSPPYQEVDMGPYILRYPVVEGKAFSSPRLEVSSYPGLLTYSTFPEALNGYKAVSSISCQPNAKGLDRIVLNYNEAASSYLNGTEDPKFITQLNGTFIPTCRTYFCPKATSYQVYNAVKHSPIDELCGDCDFERPVSSWNNPSYAEACNYFYINQIGQCSYPGHRDNIPLESKGFRADPSCGSTSGSCFYTAALGLETCFSQYPMNDSAYPFSDGQTYAKGRTMDGPACYHLQQSPGQEYLSELGVPSYVGISRFVPQYSNMGEGYAYYPGGTCGSTCVIPTGAASGTCSASSSPCYPLQMVAESRNTDSASAATNLYRDQSQGNYDPSYYRCVIGK